MTVFPNGINIKIVASENAQWLTLENHWPQWLVVKLILYNALETSISFYIKIQPCIKHLSGGKKV